MKKYNGKVFCLGISKTGTKSWHIAMGNLGYKSIHNGGRPIDMDMLNSYDAFSDSNTCWFKYDVLYEDIPNSKFVLSVRDKETWIGKILTWYNPKFKQSYIKWHRDGIYDLRMDTTEELSEFFDTYVNDIIEYFKDKQDRFIIHDVFSGDGYKKLCEFLEIESCCNNVWWMNEKYPHLINETVINGVHI